MRLRDVAFHESWRDAVADALDPNSCETLIVGLAGVVEVFARAPSDDRHDCVDALEPLGFAVDDEVAVPGSRTVASRTPA